jgi:hypothetical protein
MQFSRNTSIGRRNKTIMLFIKLALFFLLLFTVVVFLNKIDFPTPNKEIKKNIPNEKIKIVK